MRSGIMIEWSEGEYYAVRCVKCDDITEVYQCSVHGKVLRCTKCNYALASNIEVEDLEAMSGEVALQ